MFAASPGATRRDPAAATSWARMPVNEIFLWLPLVTFGFALFGAVSSRARGPVILYGGLLALVIGAHLLAPPKSASWISGIAWAIYGVAAPILMRATNRSMLTRRYRRARWQSTLLALLMPFRAFRGRARLAQALGLLDSGDGEAGLAALEDLARAGGPQADSAHLAILAARADFAGLLRAAIARDPARRPEALFHALLCLGLLGRVGEMMTLYVTHRRVASRGAAEDQAREMLFLLALNGRSQAVDAVLQGLLGGLPETQARFWRLIAAWVAAGDEAAFRAGMEELRVEAPSTLRAWVAHLLQAPPVVRPSLNEPQAQVLAQIESEVTALARFGATAPGRPWATMALIVLNGMAYVMSRAFGPLKSEADWYATGVILYPEILDPGQWWRFVTAAFLHFDIVHLGGNLLGIALICPFAERALGRPAFLWVYGVASIGSMSLTVLLHHLTVGAAEPTFILGASGGLMGVLGARLGHALILHRRERLAPARRELIALLLVLGLQTVFDLFYLPGSHVIHLSAAGIGFLLMLVARGVESLRT